MRIAVLSAVVSLAAASAAFAQADTMMVASQLGNVLAAEEFCGLTYDQEAIQAFIEKNVRADDMGFAGMLSLMTGGSESKQREMNASAKTAHCAQIRRVAKANGFIK